MRRTFSVSVFIALFFCGVATLNAQTAEEEHEKLDKSHDSRYDFVNYVMGIQYAAGAGMPFSSTGGVQFGLGIGRWMNSRWGVRLGGELATCYLNSFEDLLLNSVRADVRADMMINPLAFGKNYTPGRFGTALLLGWELGYKMKGMYTHLNNGFYNSLSLGAQLRYLTDENHTLYIEPRYTFDDRLASVTAGLEYVIGEHRFLSSKNQPGLFNRYYSLGLEGGFTHRFQSTHVVGMSQLDANVGLSGEYHFTPYSGVRLTTDYAEVTNGTTKRVGHVNIGVDYMFDLSTLYAGYTPERRLDVFLGAGPVYSRRTSKNAEVSQYALGCQAGISVQYLFADNFGLSYESRIQAFPYTGSYASLNGGRSLIFNSLLGLKYYFKRKVKNIENKE